LIAYIPSPGQSVWFIGPFPIRAYAMCILAGIVAAIWIAQHRLEDRGGEPGQVLDVALWAVPFGIVGGRLYHVISSPAAYFGDGGHPLNAFKIWEGGLGIWGAIALGTVGVWIGCRRHGVPFLDFVDAAAPGLAVAQAMGRWGNYFNQELFGGPTTLPWGLEISPVNRPAGYEQFATFHPTFLYESLWCLLIALVLVLADRRFSFARGQIFALYGMLYTLGRGLIEMLRTDQANYVFGLRLNVWTSVIVFAGSAFVFWRLGVRGNKAGSEDNGHNGSGDKVSGDKVSGDADKGGDNGDKTDNPAEIDGPDEPATDLPQSSQHSD
jgi:prolipoprotein diacylglyceryl transferase